MQEPHSQHSEQIYTDTTSCHTYTNKTHTPANNTQTQSLIDNTTTEVSMDNHNHVAEYVKKTFKDIEPKHITEFCMTLFPVCLSNNPYEGLDLSIKSFYQIKKKGTVSFDDLKSMVLKKAEDYGNGLKEALQKMYSQPSFCTYLQKSQQNYFEQLNKEIIDIEEITKEPNRSITSTKTVPPKKTQQHSQKSTRTQRSDSKLYHPQPINYSEIDQVINLADKGICLCEKQVLPLEDTFICVHCGFSYHLECMKRKEKVKHCSLCHLKKIIPNKETKKTLFLGLLKKGRKKHQFSFNLTEDDLSMKYRLQVRCFRLKEVTQNFILFPDYTDISINGYSAKEFRPLHRQSSLKYRKDEPFSAEIKYLLPKQNKVVVTEKLPSKDLKDSRIEAENHLIGLFMVEDKRIDTLVKEITNSSITPFEESKKILDSAFIQFSGSDGVSCEVVKIPLTCTLTTEKIKIPARGLFCSHYQCFDLFNYIMMTSQSSNPRWICPLCKLSCYMFKIDCILLAILEQYSQHVLSEVMFFKTGEFSVYAGDNMVRQKTNSIHNLPIESAAKRAASQLAEQQPRKKKKVSFFPQQSKIIALDID